MAGAGRDMSAMLASQPGATAAMADMAKEMEKIKGVPVMQVMRMGTTLDGKPLPAASEAPLPPDNPGDVKRRRHGKAGHGVGIVEKLGGWDSAGLEEEEG